MADPAVFADRDGTIVREAEYLSDPAGVELLPGAAAALRSFRDAGYVVVIVTNQSGIARGYYGRAEYRAVEAEVERRLAEHGVDVAGAYYCPHHPDFTGPCGCRKPGTELFEKATADHGLDPGRSVYVGDRLRDVEPARALGGTGILVRTGYGTEEAARAPEWVHVADDLEAAARWFLASGGR